jgi:hypothetical protein
MITKKKHNLNITPPPHHLQTIKPFELFGPGKIYTHLLYQKATKQIERKEMEHPKLFESIFPKLEKSTAT